MKTYLRASLLVSLLLVGGIAAWATPPPGQDDQNELMEAWANAEKEDAAANAMPLDIKLSVPEPLTTLLMAIKAKGGPEAVMLDDLEAFVGSACRRPTKQGYTPLDIQLYQLSGSLAGSISHASSGFFGTIWALIAATYIDNPDCRVGLHHLIKGIEGLVEKPRLDLAGLHRKEFIDKVSHRTMDVYVALTLLRALGGGKPNDRLGPYATGRNAVATAKRVGGWVNPFTLGERLSAGWLRIKNSIFFSEQELAILTRKAEEAAKAGKGEAPALTGAASSEATATANAETAAASELLPINLPLKSTQPFAYRLGRQARGWYEVSTNGTKELFWRMPRNWFKTKGDALKAWKENIKKLEGSFAWNLTKGTAIATWPILKSTLAGSINLSADILFSALISANWTAYQIHITGWEQTDDPKPNVEALYSDFQGMVVWGLENDSRALRSELEDLSKNFVKRMKADGLEQLANEVNVYAQISQEARQQLLVMQNQAPKFEGPRRLVRDEKHKDDANLPDQVSTSMVEAVLDECDTLNKDLAQSLMYAKVLEASGKLGNSTGGKSSETGSGPQKQAPQPKTKAQPKPRSPQPKLLP